MAYPVIIFNADTGSNTAASGAGPAVAITGTAAAHTGGVASTTITLTGSPDLSGVAVDGSAALWMKTASGRQFSKITAADDSAKTVTVEDEFTIAEASAVDFAIGGKRATWNDADSRTAFGANGVKGGWVIETETNQTITTSALPIESSGVSTMLPILIRGAASVSHPIINQTVNLQTFLGSSTNYNFRWFRNLKFTNSVTGGKTACHAISARASITVEDCIFGDPINTLTSALKQTGDQNILLVNCVVQYCETAAISFVVVTAHNCTFMHNASSAITSCNSLNVTNCIIASNGLHGIYMNIGMLTIITNCIIYGNSNDGISSRNGVPLISNSIVANNGGYGLDLDTGLGPVLFLDYNLFYNNTSGNRGFIAGAHDLATDPLFMDAANGDFRLQAGSPCINAGYPSGDIGALQRAQGTIPAVEDVEAGVSYNVGGQDGTLVGTLVAGGGGGRVIGSPIIRGTGEVAA
jgi:hypothetical protein